LQGLDPIAGQAEGITLVDVTAPTRSLRRLADRQLGKLSQSEAVRACTQSAQDSLMWARAPLVLSVRYLLAISPERLGRAVLAGTLRRFPGLWGWSEKSYRRRFECSAYRHAHPHDDAEAFLNRAIRLRATAYATSMTYMARTQAGRHSSLIVPAALPTGPCVIAYLHYAIDPALQLSLLAANRDREFRWVVYPQSPPGRPPRGELRRDFRHNLWLSGSSIPDAIEETFLHVTDPSWLLAAVRHVRGGGSMLIALDAPVDARRSASAFLTVGQAQVPVSPAIDVLARKGATLLFVSPELGPGGAWTLRYEQVEEAAALAAAASRWIDANRSYWTSWTSLMLRRGATKLRTAGLPGGEPVE
jgi:hypothetical protein